MIEPSEEDLALWRSRDDWGDLSCRELVGLVTDYFEGALSPNDTARFDHHLSLCEACEVYLAQMRQTIAATGQLREDDVSAAAVETLLDEFRRWRAQP